MLHTVAKCYAQYLSTKNNNGVLPGETTQKYFSALARYVHLYYGIRKGEKKMNSKNLRKRLENMGYILGKDIFGWVVVWPETGFTWKFPTLGGVNRFITDEENLAKYATQKGG